MVKETNWIFNFIWSNWELHKYTKHDVVASTFLQVSAASDGRFSRLPVAWASFICILSNLSNTRGLFWNYMELIGTRTVSDTLFLEVTSTFIRLQTKPTKPYSVTGYHWMHNQIYKCMCGPFGRSALELAEICGATFGTGCRTGVKNWHLMIKDGPYLIILLTIGATSFIADLYIKKG